MDTLTTTLSAQSLPSCEDVADLRLLNPESLHFFRAGATLRLTIGDEISYPKVIAACAFPLTDPKHYWSVFDGARKEIGMIPYPEKLSKENHALLEEELRRRYILPRIGQIVSIYERFGFQEWEVKTDLGERKFGVRNLRENVFHPSPGRYLITDGDGNRYEIPDYSKLDPASQILLMQHL